MQIEEEKICVCDSFFKELHLMALHLRRFMIYKALGGVFLSLPGDIHCVYHHLTDHFSHTQAGLLRIVGCKRHLTNRQRYKMVRVGGWERTLSSLLQLRDRAEQVVWGYLLSSTMSNTASGPPLLLWCGWELCCAEELQYLQHIPQPQMVHCNYQSSTFTFSCFDIISTITQIMVFLR